MIAAAKLEEAEARQQRQDELRARCEALRAQLDELNERRAARAAELDEPAPARPAHALVRHVGFTPYDRQRRLLRAKQRERCAVCGRQVGKTTAAIWATLRVAMEEPGSYSVLLAPTFPIARSAIDKLRAMAADLPGASWKEQQKRMVFANGSTWQVYSADRGGDVGRGPTLTGLLWVDEAAMVGKAAWMATLASLSAVRNPRKLLTTTPMGKNWVFDFFLAKDLERAEPVARAKRRLSLTWGSLESPLANLEEIEAQRGLMTPEFFRQEYEADFVDDLLLAFPDLSRFWAEIPFRDEDGLRHTLGVDLGKEQDWTVVTLCNKYGECWILGRWQHVNYVETEQRIADFVKKFAVGVVCLDVSGVGRGVADHLERDFKIEVLRVDTASMGQKTKLIELARTDVAHGRIRCNRPPEDPPTHERELADQLEHELLRFQGTQYASHGNKLVKYEGVQLKGEFDDCVISLALANWGRCNGWTKGEAELSDLRKFARRDTRARRGGRGRRRGPFGGLSGLPANLPAEEGICARRAA